MCSLPLDQTINHHFPQTGVTLSFGYGSKVLTQGEATKSSDLIDIIFVVDNPLQWHQENYSRNRDHYSFLRHLPNRFTNITNIQEKYGARIYFNPYVTVGTLSIKYGVIKTEHLLSDLLFWDKLYVAGRLHKPVEFIVNTCDRNEPLRSALRYNKESAIRAALLQLPETFDPKKLYVTISNLSYQGDIRMSFGEDKNKIDNIVTNQLERFQQLYLPMIRLSPNLKDFVQWNECKQMFIQDSSPKAIFKNLKLLPRDVRRSICKSHSKIARTLESDIVLASVSRSIYSSEIVAGAIAGIVRRSSLSQSLKGLLTAGFVKSIRYSQRKLFKSLASRLAWN